MALPSVDQILRGGLRTFLRFPLVLCSAFFGTISAVILIDHEAPQHATVLLNALFGSILGIPLLLGLALIAERRQWGLSRSLGLQIAGGALLAAYAWTVPSALASVPAFHVQRLLLLAVAMHMFVSVGPFLGANGSTDFWQYNKTLFFRILGAGLYSHILYLGLVFALAALDQLFGLDIPGKRYFELWIVTFGVLNTWLFLAGIPEDLANVERGAEYPKALRILVQYVLMPLAIVYLAIVTVYVIKIVLTWQWPDGWVSNLILGFSTSGLLSRLLLHPLLEREDMQWARAAFRWFFIVMIPLVVIFPLAVLRRISEYGVTEARYAALALAAWLIVVVAYFLLSKSRNIRFIPASLGVLSLGIAFGPWGMFTIGEQSQTARLRDLLIRNSILVDGTIRKAATPVRQEDAKNISSVLDYLHDIHGFDGIQPWFHESLRKDPTGATTAPKDPANVAAMLGIDYVRIRPSGGGNLVSFSMDQDRAIDIRGFDRMVRLAYINREGVTKEFPEEGTTIGLNAALDTLTIRNKSDASRTPTLNIALRQLADTLLTEYVNEGIGNVPPEKMTLSAEAEGIRARLFVRNIQTRRRGEAVEISSISVDVLYSISADDH